MFTDIPNRISASTLSPSVTATLRMLSPNRASFRPRAAAAPAAARAHEPTRARTAGLDTCPETVVRGTRRRVSMNPYSRSPWAAWLRFMKSMSIVAQGRAASAWVCRCSSGLRSASRPEIHIFAGEKVCIQVMTPRQAGSSLASPMALPDRRGVLQHGLPDDLHRHLGGVVQRGGDPLRLRRDLLEGLLAVQVLAAGQEPDLLTVECVTGESLTHRLAVDVLVARVQRVDVRLRDRDGLPQLAGEVHGAGDVLGHDGGLDGGLRRTGRW